jgi:hypothetical protein
MWAVRLFSVVRRSRAVRSIAIALAVSVWTVPNVAAYTILSNNYGSDPSNPGFPKGCTNQYDSPTGTTWWCWRWPMTPNGYSTTVYVYLDPSLGSTFHSGETNMTQQTLSAFARWNAVPASSPYLVQTSSYSQSSGYYYPYWIGTKVYRDNNLPWPILAGTWDETAWSMTGQGDPNHLLNFTIEVAGWPIYVGHQSSYTSGQADAASVLTHELGHTLGLGHTGLAAVMYPIWGPSHDLVTPTTTSGGDVPGLQLLYSTSFCLTCHYSGN